MCQQFCVITKKKEGRSEAVRLGDWTLVMLKSFCFFQTKALLVVKSKKEVYLIPDTSTGTTSQD